MAEKKTVSIPGGSEDDFLKDMREAREETMQGLQHVHAEAMDDQRMLLNEGGTGQWNEASKKFRETMVPPRPCITNNMMGPFGERVKNEQRKNKPQISCNPVDDKADKNTALIIEGLIRNIYYQSDADAVHNLAYDSQVDTSLGAWRIDSEYSDSMSNDQELRIRTIGSALVSNPLSLWWDLTCKNFVTSDKKFCGIDSVMRTKDAKKRFKRDSFPGQAESSEGTNKAGWFMTDELRITEYLYVKETAEKLITFSNGKSILKPKDDNIVRQILRSIGQRSRVVSERDTVIPEIQSCICSGSEILEGPFLIPGQYIPIIITFGRILNEQGRLHIKSLHRDAKSLQEIHNYLITTLIEQFSLQPSVPWIGTAAMFAKNPNWLQANQGGLAYLEFEADPNFPGQRPTREAPPQVNSQLFGWIAQNLSNMRDVYGIQEASLGMTSNETSRVAINARAALSDLNTLVFMSNHLLGLNFEGKILVDRIPTTYDIARALRITGIDGKATNVQVNKAFTVNTPNGPKQLMYDLTVGKYDVVVEIGPTATTQRDATMQLFDSMIQSVAPTNPVGAQVLAIEQVKLLNTPNNDRLVKLLKMTLTPEIRQAMDEEEGGLPGASDEGDGQNAAAIGQMEQVLQQQGQQLQEMQAAYAQLQAETEALKREEQSKLAKIDSDHSLGMEKIAILRQAAAEEAELKRQIAQQEFDLKAKKFADEIMFADKKATAEMLQRDNHREQERAAMPEPTEPAELDLTAQLAPIHAEVNDLTRTVKEFIAKAGGNGKHEDGQTIIIGGRTAKTTRIRKTGDGEFVAETTENPEEIAVESIAPKETKPPSPTEKESVITTEEGKVYRVKTIERPVVDATGEPESEG